MVEVGGNMIIVSETERGRAGEGWYDIFLRGVRGGRKIRTVSRVNTNKGEEWSYFIKNKTQE